MKTKDTNDEPAKVSPQMVKVQHTEGSAKLDKFDDIFEVIGAFGHWQRVIFVLISLADVHAVFAVLLPIYVGATPRWRCVETEAGSINTTSESNSNSTQWRQCRVNESKCVTFEFEDNFTSIVGDWGLVCDYIYASDLITTIQMVGLAVGATVFGQVSDLIGRKKTYYITFLLMIMAGFASAFCHSWILYAVCRHIMGWGFGGLLVVATIYPMEFVGKRWRVCCGTLGFWSIGTMILAAMAYFIRDWRHLTIASTISGLPFLCTWWVIPESPRWLMEQGRIKEATEVMAYIAKRNSRPPLDTQVLERIAKKDKVVAEHIKRYTYLDIIRVPAYLKRTVIMFFAWFATFSLYYQVSFNLKNLSGDIYVNSFISGAADLICQLSVILILQCLGRRLGLMAYMFVASCCLLGILALILTEKEHFFPQVVVALALLGKSSSLGGTYGCQLLSAELFPTVIRNLGVGSGALAGRLGGMIAPQIVFLGTVYRMAPYILCSAMAIIVIPIALLLPETRGRPLEDAFHPHDTSSSSLEQESNLDMQKPCADAEHMTSSDDPTQRQCAAEGGRLMTDAQVHGSLLYTTNAFDENIPQTSYASDPTAL